MNKLVWNAVGLTIGVILLGSLLVPIIVDATETSRTFTNIGEFEMTSDDTEYYLTYAPSEAKYIVNGEDVPFDSIGSGSAWTVISTDLFTLRFNNYGDHNLWLLQSTSKNRFDSTHYFKFVNGEAFRRGNEANDWFKFADYSSDSFRGIIAGSGDYITSNGSEVTILLSDSIIAQTGTTTVDSWDNIFNISGTVEDMEVTALTDGISVSNVHVNYEPMQKYKAYTFESVSFTASSSTNDVSTTYDRVIVPKEVTAEILNPFGSGAISILLAIPVMLIVGMLCISVKAIQARK